MKKIILTVLLTIIAINTPFRLMALVVESFMVTEGRSRLTQADDAYWKALDLEDRLITMGWPVGYARHLVKPGEGTPVYGLTMQSGSMRVILIESELHWNARFAILAHEGGHTLQPGWLNENQGDAFAESVAALVAHDGLREHARYLANMRVDLLVVAITEWRAIYRAASLLEER